MINPIHLLEMDIKSRLPGAVCHVDGPPLLGAGTWWLDARVDDHKVVSVSFTRGRWGLYWREEGGYGGKPDEVYDRPVDILEAVIKHLT